MPDVQFHVGVADRTLYGCRLLRKAARQGVRVLVRGEALQIGLLDKALWTFDPQDFVPHHRLRAGALPSVQHHRTPIWLVAEGEEWPQEVPRAHVLVQWGGLAAEDWSQWERVIEVVGQDKDERLLARRRWRAYEAQGCKPHALDLSGGDK